MADVTVKTLNTQEHNRKARRVILWRCQRRKKLIGTVAIKVMPMYLTEMQKREERVMAMNPRIKVV